MSATAVCCEKGLSSGSGFSPPLAMPAARLVWHNWCGTVTLRSRGASLLSHDAMKGSYLGPEYDDEAIEQFLEGVEARYLLLGRESLCERVAALLAAEQVVGWFDGRMEFGPRALGARSILGDPRSPRMQAQMNLKIKFREGFRPFAPSVLRERVSEYFELDAESPYMLLVAPVREDRRLPIAAEQQTLWGIDRLNLPGSDVPAITHVDYSARIQTVCRETNPHFYDLIAAFERLTGYASARQHLVQCARGTDRLHPADAYRCFMRTHMDALVLGGYLLYKGDQPATSVSHEWQHEYQLD